MNLKATRKHKARELYCQQNLTYAEVAALLGLRPSTVQAYATEDAKAGQRWQRAQEPDWSDDAQLRREFLDCLGLLLAEARRCLKDLRSDSLLGPEVRAKQIGNLMGIIEKATQTAKKFDPILNLESVVTGCLKVVGEVFIERAPELSEVFLAQTQEIERRLVEVKDQWRL